MPPTSHQACILVLLREYCRPEQDVQNDSLMEDESLMTSGWSMATRHKISLLLVKWMKDGGGGTLASHCQELVEYIPVDGEDLAEELREIFKELTTQLDDIFLFYDSVEQLIMEQDDGVEQLVMGLASEFGIFVRRSLLEFNRMSLAQVCRHWGKLKAFAEADDQVQHTSSILDHGGSADVKDVPSMPMMDDSYDVGSGSRSRSPPMSPSSPPTIAMSASTPASGGNNGSAATRGGGGGQRGAGAASKRPITQLEWHQAEKELLQEALATQSLGVGPFKEKIARVLAKLSQKPLGHYIRHVYAMHTGDFTSALNGLHHFFDMQAPRAIVRKQAADGSIVKTRRVNFHYAALSLASLHYRFGHVDEALRAVHESVRIAQENSDPICLHHALGWLTRLGMGSTSDSLTTLFVKSTAHYDVTNNPEEAEGQYLHGLSLLTKARQSFWQGKSPASVLDLVGSSLNIGAKQSSAELVGLAYMLQAGLFDLYGHSGLAMLYPQLLLQHGKLGTPSETCEAYCKIAAYYFTQGRPDISSRVLAAAEKEFPLFTPYAKLWAATQCQIKHQQALYDENWSDAAAVSLELNGLVGSLNESSLDAELDIFKGAGMLGATVILWIQIYSICNRYMTPQEQLEVPGGMAVYLGTKCMFFTYFFLELFPYTQGENALTGYAWDTAVVFFSCSLWYNWYKTHTSDPGYLPSATDKPREAARDITRLAEQGKLVKENFCLSCCIRKPIRSKHDSFTNKCVARFDHYCPFVGNPVGGDNHKYFMYFVMSLSPLVLLYTVLLFRYMAVVCPDTDGFFDMIFTYAYCKPFAAWTIFHGCLHTLWTSGLAMAQINQIFSDLTTNEAMNRFRYSYLSRGSPWSKGCMGNVLEFFCRQSLNWKTMYELPNSKMTV